MLDRAFVKKKMNKVIASYIQDPTIKLTEEEIDHLLEQFERRIENETDESIHFILHDVIYEYLTQHYF